RGAGAHGARGGFFVRAPRAARGIYQMRVAVDEPRHDHPSDRVDLRRAARRREVFDAAGRSHLLDDAVLNENCAVRNDAQFVEIYPTAGSLGAAQCKHLPRSPNQCQPVAYSQSTMIGAMAKRPQAQEERRLKTLERVFSKAGLASRTDARSWIGAGRVRVNGKVVQNPDHWVDLDRDRVTLDGKPLRAR